MSLKQSIEAEQKRLILQEQLDQEKTQAERNKLGQFATPTKLATELLTYAKNLMPTSEKVRFLDPAFGTGTFYSALLRLFDSGQIEKAWGYEIDSHYGANAAALWKNSALNLTLADFTQVTPPVTTSEKFNLIVCNPPYVRHHHINNANKSRLQQLVIEQTNYRLNGLAGLYCYFLLLSQKWMVCKGLAGWLLPSEFLEVNYGKEVKQFLLKNVTLLHIHRFDPKETQFDDALVSSVVVWLKNSLPAPTHQVKFSFGGTLTNPAKVITKPHTTLKSDQKWSWTQIKNSRNKWHSTVEPSLKLSDLFSIKRGIVTGANKFFILTARQIVDLELPQECIRPILPGPRALEQEEIEADEAGLPKIAKQLFLLDCSLPESVLKAKHPPVWNYLQTGVEQNIHQRYLCRHRTPWYAQEQRPAAPILCTYMGRISQTSANPFRFILNHSQATAPNVYLLLYPKPALAKQLQSDAQQLRAIWQALRQITPADLIAEGRVYGGGLHKLEPGELANAKIKKADIPALDKLPERVQLSLF